ARGKILARYEEIKARNPQFWNQLEATEAAVEDWDTYLAQAKRQAAQRDASLRRRQAQQRQRAAPPPKTRRAQRRQPLAQAASAQGVASGLRDRLSAVVPDLHVSV